MVFIGIIFTKCKILPHINYPLFTHPTGVSNMVICFVDVIGSPSDAMPYLIKLLFTICSIMSLYFGINSYGSNG